MQPRVIMLADLDYFFAQCEEKRNPDIKSKPVVVCVYSGRTEGSGAVSTANYIARRYGVKSGMPIFLAKKKLENTNAIFLPVDHEFYEAISNRIMLILKGHADRFEQVGIDEAYLDVSQKVNGQFETAKQLAQEIKNSVKAQEGITCTIGIGPNKLVAKIASDNEKPDGITLVKPQQVESFLSPLPVNRLIGIGNRTNERMNEAGIKTIGELARFDAVRLSEIFGQSLGDYFHNASLGVDNENVQERGEADSISRIATLKQNTRELQTILAKTEELCKDIHFILMQRKAAFRSVAIIAIMTNLTVRTRSKKLDAPTNELETLKANVTELFEKFLADSELEIRRVGVKVSGFEGWKNQKTLMEYG